MLAQLLLNGVVGPMHIGQTKTELLAVLGPPSMWYGKPGTILDRGIPDYERSKSWIYNGIYVDFEDEAIAELNIWVAYPIDFTHAWFKEWNLPPIPRLSHIIEYLDSFDIPFAITPTKPGDIGCELILFEAVVQGVVEQMVQRNQRVEEINVYGIARFNSSLMPGKFYPSFDIASLDPLTRHRLRS